MAKMHDHCGPMNSKSEMMKAWDAPGGQSVKEAGAVAKVGGQKTEKGAKDAGEMK